MKFTYIGEAPNGFIELYGVKFVPGEASEVSDAFAIRKLSANRFFEVVEDTPAPKLDPDVIDGLAKALVTPPKRKRAKVDGDVQ